MRRFGYHRGRMNGGGDINSLGLLPDKLKTELALHVNLETLKKVCESHITCNSPYKIQPYRNTGSHVYLMNNVCIVDKVRSPSGCITTIGQMCIMSYFYFATGDDLPGV